jgi:phosphatidylinositol 4-kinase
MRCVQTFCPHYDKNSHILLQVTRLTVSMLLQHLRSAEPTVEAVIAFNLVDLALCAPENAFIDIIRAFSAINRTANPDDPRLSNNMVRWL